MGKGKRLREERKAAGEQRTINTPPPQRTDRPTVAKEKRHRMRRAFNAYRQLPEEAKAELLRAAAERENTEPEGKTNV